MPARKLNRVDAAIEHTLQTDRLHSSVLAWVDVNPDITPAMRNEIFGFVDNAFAAGRKLGQKEL